MMTSKKAICLFLLLVFSPLAASFVNAFSNGFLFAFSVGSALFSLDILLLNFLAFMLTAGDKVLNKGFLVIGSFLKFFGVIYFYYVAVVIFELELIPVVVGSGYSLVVFVGSVYLVPLFMKAISPRQPRQI